jgi:hypothetical protein
MSSPQQSRIQQPTLHLIDASLYIFRAWHAVPMEFHDTQGAPVNAVYGFTRFLCDFLERAKPTHTVVAFDESLTSSFRNAIYPEYKANRELPPAQSASVVGDIPGTDKSEEIVILGAHLDSWDPGVGAIDDGAGVAIVMGVAKLISGLATLQTKRDKNPPKKHGNIPL